MSLTAAQSADSGALPDQYRHWRLERRHDGAVVVRVPSARSTAAPLPDAVFAFQAGDPQFGFWEGLLRQRQS